MSTSTCIVYEEFIIINEKLSFVEDVPPTVANTSGTSGAPTQGRDSEIIENIENVPLLNKEQSMSSGFESLQIGTSSSPSKIWIKYGDSQPVKIVFDGDVNDLIEAIKEKLSPDLDDVPLDRITLRRHDEEVNLRADLTVDQSFVNTYDTPLQVIVNVPMTLKRKHEESPENLSDIVKSAVREELSREKGSLPITSTHVMSIVHMGRGKGQRSKMHNVRTWFEHALKLPSDFQVNDIHKQVTNQCEWVVPTYPLEYMKRIASGLKLRKKKMILKKVKPWESYSGDNNEKLITKSIIGDRVDKNPGEGLMNLLLKKGTSSLRENLKTMKNDIKKIENKPALIKKSNIPKDPMLGLEQIQIWVHLENVEDEFSKIFLMNELK
ncbi:5270_t:CDS:2 [Diversispora eburnea]|uniref:5270_t:CDS:1 n=1 Tax=Diversispora eburnea TaxID=1213867 RepID=A0A9N9AV45_9GLOM|nr:5270_t:CDS:2 [Diversispora eburnea]